MKSRVLGGVGALLMVGGAIPYVGFALMIAGLVVLLIAYRRISNEVKNNEVWSGIFRWLIFGFVSSFVFIFGGLLVFLGLLSGVSMGLLVSGIVLGLAAYGFVLLSTWNFYQANKALAKSYKNDLFRVAGLLGWVAGLTSIIFVGFLISLVSKALLAVAFLGEK